MTRQHISTGSQARFRRGLISENDAVGRSPRSSSAPKVPLWRPSPSSGLRSCQPCSSWPPVPTHARWRGHRIGKGERGLHPGSMVHDRVGGPPSASGLQSRGPAATLRVLFTVNNTPPRADHHRPSEPSERFRISTGILIAASGSPARRGPRGRRSWAGVVGEPVELVAEQVQLPVEDVLVLNDGGAAGDHEEQDHPFEVA
jgi:hypothetical protein